MKSTTEVLSPTLETKKSWNIRLYELSQYYLLQLLERITAPSFILLDCRDPNAPSKPYALSTDTRYTIMRAITYLHIYEVGHTLLLVRATFTK
jgi:hypothetical protein